MTEYYALIEPDRKHGFVVTFPDLGHGGTQGESLTEAMEMAQDLLQRIIAELMTRGEPLPASSRRRGRNFRPIPLPALQSAKVDLYSVFQNSGVRKSELARRMGISKTNVERLFDLDHASRLDQIEAAFLALGKKIEFRISDAA